MWVSPFRNLRINGYVLLPEAYRSLSRLSSALSAKASTLRSYSLDQPCIALHDRQVVFTCLLSQTELVLHERLKVVLASDVFFFVSIPTYSGSMSVCSFQGAQHIAKFSYSL